MGENRWSFDQERMQRTVYRHSQNGHPTRASLDSASDRQLAQARIRARSSRSLAQAHALAVAARSDFTPSTPNDTVNESNVLALNLIMNRTHLNSSHQSNGSGSILGRRRRGLDSNLIHSNEDRTRRTVLVLDRIPLLQELVVSPHTPRSVTNTTSPNANALAANTTGWMTRQTRLNENQ